MLARIPALWSCQFRGWAEHVNAAAGSERGVTSRSEQTVVSVHGSRRALRSELSERTNAKHTFCRGSDSFLVWNGRGNAGWTGGTWKHYAAEDIFIVSRERRGEARRDNNMLSPTLLASFLLLFLLCRTSFCQYSSDQCSWKGRWGSLISFYFHKILERWIKRLFLQRLSCWRQKTWDWPKLRTHKNDFLSWTND